MTLHAGSATVDVTPDGPVPMSGYGSRTEPSSGVHDPLSAAALVLDDGATTVAVASVDLLNVSRPLTATVERRLDEAGVAPDELVLAATHTHGGPYVPAPVIDIHPTLSVEEDVSDVVEGIADGIVDAVETAAERLEPATIRVGTAENETTAVNRRRDLGAKLASTEIDPTVRALLVEGASGAETILFNLACHPVCTTPSNRLLTADWPGVARDEIESARPGETTTVFCNGAAGDLNPRGRSDDTRDGDDQFDYASAVGREYAESVLDAVDDAESAAGHDLGPIVTDRREIRLPVKSTPEIETLDARETELEAALEGLRADGHHDAAGRVGNELQYVRELRAIAEWSARHLPARLQYVQVGPAGLLSFPGEAFSRHGLDFAAAADADELFPVGYATDYVGYLPTLSALERFGYEVWTTKVAPEAILAFREAGFDLVDAARSGRSADRSSTPR